MSPVRNLFHGSLFFVIVTYAQRESANEKLKRCCKAQESKFTNNQTAINVCLRAYCDFDSISQTNVFLYYIMKKDHLIFYVRQLGFTVHYCLDDLFMNHGSAPALWWRIMNEIREMLRIIYISIHKRLSNENIQY